MSSTTRTLLHPLQSHEWKEFRKKTGVKMVQTSSQLQLTIHQIPYTPWTIGYLPKGPLPTEKMVDELKEIGKRERCIFIQLEPNVPLFTSEVAEWPPRRWNVRTSFHPLFTKYTFVLDLTKGEEELLKNMHQKTRYNIRVAQKHGVTVSEDNSDEAFETYLKLTEETTKRQKFYAHDEKYHRMIWETLRPASRGEQAQGKHSSNELTARLLIAKYKGEVLVAWMLFACDGVLYYSYGASSSKHHKVMASNLMMWETIRFGKKLGLKTFDMWGSLGPNPDKNDPWYGFHRFKEGYGPTLVEFVGSYDLIINPILYEFYKIADRIRWLFLRLFRFH